MINIGDMLGKALGGNVIVEIMHTPNAQDFSLMWGWAHDYFLEHGDAYVAVTVRPVAAKAANCALISRSN
mgnify:CR=1 FL=1